MTDQSIEVNFDDVDEDGPVYGKQWSQDNPDIHVKWVADGACTLSDAATGLEEYAAYCRDLEMRGWQLSSPVDNSHGSLVYVGEGDPPESDRVKWSGSSA